jgi:hypothetical protein
MAEYVTPGSQVSKANGGAIAGAIIGAVTGAGAVGTTAVQMFPAGLEVPWYGYVIAAVAPGIVGALVGWVTVYMKAPNGTA